MAQLNSLSLRCSFYFARSHFHQTNSSPLLTIFSWLNFSQFTCWSFLTTMEYKQIYITWQFSKLILIITTRYYLSEPYSLSEKFRWGEVSHVTLLWFSIYNIVFFNIILKLIRTRIMWSYKMLYFLDCTTGRQWSIIMHLSKWILGGDHPQDSDMVCLTIHGILTQQFSHLSHITNGYR